MSSTVYYCPILMKLEFSRQLFEKYSDIKFNENPSSGSGDVPCGLSDGRTDRQTDGEASSHFPQFFVKLILLH
jgi:hypothetical protein